MKRRRKMSGFKKFAKGLHNELTGIKKNMKRNLKGSRRVK